MQIRIFIFICPKEEEKQSHTGEKLDCFSKARTIRNFHIIILTMYIVFKINIKVKFKKNHLQRPCKLNYSDFVYLHKNFIGFLTISWNKLNKILIHFTCLTCDFYHYHISLRATMTTTNSFRFVCRMQKLLWPGHKDGLA